MKTQNSLYGMMSKQIDRKTCYPDSLAVVIADRAIQQTISSDELKSRLAGLFPCEIIFAAVEIVKSFESECDSQPETLSQFLGRKLLPVR